MKKLANKFARFSAFFFFFRSFVRVCPVRKRHRLQAFLVVLELGERVSRARDGRARVARQREKRRRPLARRVAPDAGVVRQREVGNPFGDFCVS